MICTILGEEPCDAAYVFSLEHNINDEQRHQLTKDACAKIKCYRSKPLLDDVYIRTQNGDDFRLLEIYEGDEPADVVYTFARQHGLDEDFRAQVLSEACQYTPCTRHKAGKCFVFCKILKVLIVWLC